MAANPANLLLMLFISGNFIICRLQKMIKDSINHKFEESMHIRVLL
ncbi:hypothetical protein BCO26_2112 [Heyndrickxia coagulans 2-6]|nr:hypothetical protein BCO26_2112 [Heyndrickxia coagulans 2-6]